MKKLISSEDATRKTVQHTSPCSDCPWSRTSLNGWLGGVSVDQWLHRAHTDTFVPCHTTPNQQCAGLAIYRRNTCKAVHAPLLTLPADKETVFSWRSEFIEHHTKYPTLTKAGKRSRP